MDGSHRCAAVLGAVMLAFACVYAPASAFGLATGKTSVSIRGDRFLINGTPSYLGTPAEGLLLNARMVQATFDDANQATAVNWRYPDTGTWSAQRNVDEFAAAVPSYAAKGLRAVTLNFQGGLPKTGYANDQPHDNSGFASDGTLKPAYTARMDEAIRALDANGMVAIVGFFYFGQDHLLADEAAVVKATDQATDWLLGQGYSNVLVEINNEADSSYDHAILRPARVGELIARVRTRSGGRLKVSTSFTGGYIPSDDTVQKSDFVLLHGNSQTSTGVASMIAAVRSKSVWRTNPKPIVFNEDSTNLVNLDVALGQGASWGYYEQGQNNYLDGFQSPPVNWAINTPTKTAFFERIAALSSLAMRVSASPTRASPQPLAGRTLSGSAYVFIPAQSGVVRVSFYLDDRQMSGAPRWVENYAPYDFAGGTSSTANPFDTRTIADGPHTITAAIDLSTGVRLIANATFAVDNSTYTLLASAFPDRRNPVPLAGRRVAGQIYAFISPQSGIVRVSFYLDDRLMSGPPRQIESYEPWDFAGGTVSAANPFNTRMVADGNHTITAAVSRSSGGNAVIQTDFTVANG